jgi:hypothetical protein
VIVSAVLLVYFRGAPLTELGERRQLEVIKA